VAYISNLFAAASVAAVVFTSGAAAHSVLSSQGDGGEAPLEAPFHNALDGGSNDPASPILPKHEDDDGPSGEPVDVREFGAAGDGTTLDTDAIMAAFAYNDERGGGEVLFASHCVFRTGPLNVTGT